MIKCTFCGGKLPASKASLTVNVAPEHAHLAPAGTFCLGVDKNCFTDASAGRPKVQSLHDDADVVIGVD